MNIQNFLKTDHVQRNRWWHWILGLIFIVVIWFVGVLGFATLYLLPTQDSNTTALIEHLFLLLSFLPLILGLWLVMRFWHKDPFIKIFTAAKRFRWGYFWRAAIIVALASIIFTAIDYAIDPADYSGFEINPNLSLYWKLLIITLLLVPFQAASEELFLRGYLNRALGRYIKNPWVVFFITSAGFAALHAGNTEAAGHLWPYLTLIFTFGFFMCVLLYFEGGLESAISFHIINNIFAFSIMGYRLPDFAETPLLVSDIPDFTWSDTLWTVLMMSITCALIIWANRKWGHVQHV